MKRLIVLIIALTSLCTFGSDKSFESKFKEVNPKQKFSPKRFKKYKSYKKVMYKWLELGEKAKGDASEKFYNKVESNLNFFQKYFKDYVKTELNGHPEIKTGFEMGIAIQKLKRQEELQKQKEQQELIGKLEEEASECMDEANDPTCGDSNIAEANSAREEEESTESIYPEVPPVSSDIQGNVRR